jgi:hypothetical protein
MDPSGASAWHRAVAAAVFDELWWSEISNVAVSSRGPSNKSGRCLSPSWQLRLRFLSLASQGGEWIEGFVEAIWVSWFSTRD